MKILVLNLPYKRKVIRKYSCSYHATGFLYPPVELVRVASIIKQKADANTEVVFIDAIALNLSYKNCDNEIKILNPDIIISLTSIDFIAEEKEYLFHIKNITAAKLIVIGYLPSLFKDKFAFADSILDNRFEGLLALACSNATQNAESFIQYLKENEQLDLIFDPDIIYKIDLSFINDRLYSELFAHGKTAFTYFSFGCPYKCSFCIRTYGLNKHSYRKDENILAEIDEYRLKGYKNIRLLDDNCNLNKNLLRKIVEYQETNNYYFNFYGLTRLDLLDEESLDLFAKLKFKSLLIGVETISEKTQLEYNKKLDLDFNEIFRKFSFLNNKKVEITVFILYNPLIENRTDLRKTLKFLSKLPIKNASLSFANPYPGTKFFEKNIAKIDFHFDTEYLSRFNPEYYLKIKRVELWFMLSFYLSTPKKMFFVIKKAFLNPIQVTKIFFTSLGFLLFEDDKNYF